MLTVGVECDSCGARAEALIRLPLQWDYSVSLPEGWKWRWDNEVGRQHCRECVLTYRNPSEMVAPKPPRGQLVNGARPPAGCK